MEISSLLTKGVNSVATVSGGDFRNLVQLLLECDPKLKQLLDGGIDGVVMDLGMSSMQVRR